jgi:3-oxoacyl-[acyl-carrier protein] reductase
MRLAKAGAAVAVNYRERGQDAASVVDLVKRNGGRAAAFGADVSNRDAVQRLLSEVEQSLGSVDILVNNAGRASARKIDEITEDDFDRAVAINLKAAFLCTQAVLHGMRSRRWGRIVNISSIGARIGAGSSSPAFQSVAPERGTKLRRRCCSWQATLL